jgi:hypothetical protein
LIQDSGGACYRTFEILRRWYEERITHWRYVLAKKPPVLASKQEEVDKMDTLWNRADSALLEELKTEIISGPVLKRPDWNR